MRFQLSLLRERVLALSPAWLLSAPFLGLVAQTMAEVALQRCRDGGADVSIGAGNTKACQAVKTNLSTEKHGTSLPLTVSLLRAGATYLWWAFGESSGLEL